MLNKFFFSMLLTATLSMMSFTAVKNISGSITGVKGGNSLTVTNFSAGTVVLNWSFSPSTVSYYIVIEDVAHRSVVNSGQTGQTSYTVYGLTPGTYRFTVSNGSSYIIIDEQVVM